MIKHLVEVLVYFLYYFGIFYFIFCDVAYLCLKLKKDDRVKNVGFFKFLNSPIKIIKGDK